MPGSWLASAIVNGPVPGILKSTVFVPPAVFAWVIASRSEPVPVSRVLTTV
jgi:hypothetical protein